MEMAKTEVAFEKKEISCDNCDYKSKEIQPLREHIELEHLAPYRKKIQQKTIAAYKCDECAFAVPTRSSLRIHVNSKHRKQKQNDKSPVRRRCEDPLKIYLEVQPSKNKLDDMEIKQ